MFVMPTLSSSFFSHSSVMPTEVAQSLSTIAAPTSMVPQCHTLSLTSPYLTGFCVLECKDTSSTTFQCGQQITPYRTKAIFPDNKTIVLSFPGLHGLISNVCTAHQKDSVTVPSPPLTTFTILNFMLYYRCHIESGHPHTLQDHFTTCGDDVVYGPYATRKFPAGLPPADCSTIKLPNSTDNSFSIVYTLPDVCSQCTSDRTRCIDQTTKEFHCPEPGKRRKIGVIILGSVAGALVLISGVYFCRRLKDKFTRDNKSFEIFLKNYGSLAPTRYTYSDIKKMTSSFKEKLGKGGYSGVYKGKLLDGRLVAVKLLKHSKGNGEDFINEVASISRTNHVNVVTLLGFCCAGRKRALVYEFMENGSLEKFINDGTKQGQSLPLETLFHVVLGIARGLEYLHQGCKTRILHFDIKPHNILLDKDFCPKISDFGLAKVSQQNMQSKVSMSGRRGTIGYISPEMFCRNFGEVSHKSDVYSYRMMVLEIIGSRKRQDAEVECSSELIFPQWIYDRLKHGDDAEVDGIMQNLNDEKGLKRKMVIVSLWCIQTVPTCRPPMSSVLRMLEGSLESIQIPPMPSLSSPPCTHFDPSGSSIAALGTESSRNFQ